MKISQSLTVSCGRDRVWNFFQNIPTVATCFPGATLKEDRGNGEYLGNVLIKLGPFTATFEGEATHIPNSETMSGNVDGKAVDKKGGSRSRLSMHYQLAEIDGSTRIDFEADIQLAGPIAQFGRVGIIEEAAQLLIEEFVKNVEQKMALDEGKGETDRAMPEQDIGTQDRHPTGDHQPPSLSAGQMLWSLVKRYLSKIFSR